MSYFMTKMLERQDGVDDLCLIVSNNDQAVVGVRVSAFWIIFLRVEPVLFGLREFCVLDGCIGCEVWELRS